MARSKPEQVWPNDSRLCLSVPEPGPNIHLKILVLGARVLCKRFFLISSLKSGRTARGQPKLSVTCRQTACRRLHDGVLRSQAARWCRARQLDLNHSTGDSYTRCLRRTAVTCGRVRPVYQWCVGRFRWSQAKAGTRYSVSTASWSRSSPSSGDRARSRESSEQSE